MLYRLALCTILVVLLSGCTSKAPREVAATPTEISAFTQKPVDPRRYGIMVYSSDKGHHFKNAFRVHPGQTAEFPFRSARGSSIPVIQFALSSTAILHAVLDTSTRHSWVDLATAASLRVEPLGPRLMYAAPPHVDDPLTGIIGFLWRMDMDNIRLGNVPLAIRPALNRLGPLERGITRPHVPLALGNDLLKTFSTLHIDFPGRRVVLATSQSYVPTMGKLLARQPLKRYKDSVVVQASIPHYSGYFILDTAGDYELAMPSPEAPVAEFFTMQNFTASKVKVINSSTWAAVGSTLPRIGAKLLSGCKMTLDGKNNMLYLEKP